MGFAEITHPYHPFFKMKFEVLFFRKNNGFEIVSLRHPDRGSFAVPRDWTDLSVQSPSYFLEKHQSILNYHCLVELSELLKNINDEEV